MFIIVGLLDNHVIVEPAGKASIKKSAVPQK